MEGILTLHDLRLTCVLGVYPHEREHEQTVEVTLSFCLAVPEQDELSQTLDYDHIATLCQHVAHHGQFQLIESLARAIYLTLLDHYKLEKLRVKVRKLQVPKRASAVSFEVGQ
ncbi:MAG: dihydroneopterin aldolase [Verrucomicrobia bacterium]|nr:dihydroneopterin aldolase [Verrucomicrobiota bacterium]MBS0646066.1 dihydroneopterin aldolase [Verrucomicrobiota bacterium]